MKGRKRVVEYSRSWRRCKGKEGEERKYRKKGLQRREGGGIEEEKT